MKTLEELRGDRSLTRVAEEIGISKSYLSLLEKGKRKMSLDIAGGLSNAYGVSVDTILLAYKVCRKSTCSSDFRKPTGTG